MLSDVEVLVLCGGEGKRLRSMVSDVPKPMAPINGKPFLDYLIRSAAAQGFTNFCFLSGYKTETIESHFNHHFISLVRRFSIEHSPLGTGGAILQAIRTSSFEKFLVLNGDTFFNIDLKKFFSTWEPGTLKLALKSIDDPSRYGSVETNGEGQVLTFVEKGSRGAGPGLINGGIYALGKSLLSVATKSSDFISLENDIFPLLLKEKRIFSQSFDGDFIDIGVPEDYIRAQSLIENWLTKAKTLEFK